MEINAFRVCVECLTFNHAQYIVDCMNGFTIQQTEFPYVCCILDDASTDSEPETVREYVLNNFRFDDPAFVRKEECDDYVLWFAQHNTNKNCFFAVFFLKYNHYSKKKDQTLYLKEWQSNTKYTAVCEGDDYWIDPLKLQKQYDFMEANPKCSLCFHAHYNLRPRNEMQIHKPRFVKSFYCLEDIIPCNGGFMATNAMFYHGGLVNKGEIPDFWKNCPIGDLPAMLFLASKGSVGYLDEIMSVHRALVPSSWTVKHHNINNIRAHYASMIKMYDEYDIYTEYKYHDIIKKRKRYNKKVMIRKEAAFFLRKIWNAFK